MRALLLMGALLWALLVPGAPRAEEQEPAPVIFVIPVGALLEDLDNVRDQARRRLRRQGGDCHVRMAIRWHRDRPGQVEVVSRCGAPEPRERRALGP